MLIDSQQLMGFYDRKYWESLGKCDRVKAYTAQVNTTKAIVEIEREFLKAH